LAKIRQIRADNPDYGAYRIYLDLKLYHNYKGKIVIKTLTSHGNSAALVIDKAILELLGISMSTPR